MSETYELALLYLLHNVKMPKAIAPVVILIGDEMPYDFIPPDLAESVASVKLEKRISTAELVRRVKERYSLYLIRKPYGRSGANSISEEDRQIRAKWVGLLGEDHVCDLPDPARVVDVIFGILAKEAGRIDDFREELEGRQNPNQVKTVYKSLKTVHLVTAKPPDEIGAGKSILKIEALKGSGTKKLL